MKPERTISGTPIFIVDDHADVIEAWRNVRLRLENPPVLLSLDYHTDTTLAFRRDIFKMNPKIEDMRRVEELSAKYCMDAMESDECFRSTIRLLKHDEHIDAAIQMKIINHAYVISHKDGSPTLRKTKPSDRERLEFVETYGIDKWDSCPFTPFDLPENRIFEIPKTCPPWCCAEDHSSSQCQRNISNAALETNFLDWKLGQISEMAQCVGIADVTDGDFILDIDLDYFRTLQAIEPKNPKRFYDLIVKASAITVATEARCVENCRMQGESHTADILLERLWQHLHTALDHT